QIAAAVNRIFPEVTGLDVLSPNGITAIHASVRGVDRKIPLGLVSSGVTKFVAILIGIVWARRGGVLIDEIENGLYYKLLPEMWSEISQLAKENKTQVFATTHSKEFLDAMLPSVQADDNEYALLHLEKLNGEAKISDFAGRQFAGAV